MAEGHKPPWRDKPSIKYRCGSSRGACFEIVNYGLKDHVSASATDKKSKTPEPRDTQICSTRELISALASVWDNVTDPLSILVNKSTGRYESGCQQECSVLWHSSEGGTHNVHVAVNNQNCPIHPMKTWDSLPSASERLGFVKVRDKISFIQPSSGTKSLLRQLLHGNDHMIQDPLKGTSASNVDLKCHLHGLSGWMTRRALSTQERLANFTGMEKHDGVDFQIGLNSCESANFGISVGGNGRDTNLVIENDDTHTEENKFTEICFGQNDDPNTSVKASSATVCINHRDVQDLTPSSSFFPNSSHCEDSLVLPFGARDFGEREISGRADLQENTDNHLQDGAVGKKSKVGICFPVKEKSNGALAKQEHAYAGAMAGIFVSLSLHPVDTVKTVIQSCRADQRSLLDTCRSIISQRGITGLYRGISTNIASSAPISAVYTFTYESMKGVLLPSLPMEYQSVAHCVAGGCASIATSFIFTPSERIKQQMQVGSRYQNCWNAFMGIVERGGLTSLYAGWGAVLCRNVPHSIIKFYTYESMKQLLSSVQLDGQTNTIVTLVSGGLAASTAALFTTPFDVVKTRLQTQVLYEASNDCFAPTGKKVTSLFSQIPGSLNLYGGVFDALLEIAKNEGLRGLYRLELETQLHICTLLLSVCFSWL
ncbi:OLC1v1029731C1 [Oldenlandia corymbosa var. corymbosa]|uniref:OLC1v1029731C1 n=1 Tax=Oldenlandia corymbosa var. corymbosa TaxID=529605 RepID=A0AAV1CGA8_OLDCO|nr:OLC1v1029731C1 [Oldenlandia corymbosa var. corymbosa]